MLNVIRMQMVSPQSGNGTLDQSACVLHRPRNSVRKNLRSLLYSVAEGLNSEDINKILFLTSDIIKSKPVKERIKSQGSSLDLLEVLLERDALDENNINVLFDLLSKIRRFDVLKKAKTRWDRLKRQVNPDDQHAPCLVSSCHDGSSPSEPQHLSRPLRGLTNDGIVERRRLQFEEGLNKGYRPRGSYRGLYPTTTGIDWNDEEVQELMKELFRPRSTPVNRKDGAREYHARCRYSPSAWRDYLTQSFADGSYYCPTDEARDGLYGATARVHIHEEQADTKDTEEERKVEEEEKGEEEKEEDYMNSLPHETVPDEVKPIKLECCKRVGVQGGKLHLNSFGIELDIPPGAIDSEVPQLVESKEGNHGFVSAHMELQVLIQAEEGDLKMTCFVNETVIGRHVVVPFNKLISGTSICEPFQLDFTNQPDIVAVLMKVGQTDDLHVEFLFHLDFSTPHRRKKVSPHDQEKLQGASISQTLQPSQRSPGKTLENISGGQEDFDDKLTTVAQKVARREEIDNLGKALGFGPEDIQRYVDTHMNSESYMGTLSMLRKWRKKQTVAKECEALMGVLRKAGQIRLVDEL